MITLRLSNNLVAIKRGNIAMPVVLGPYPYLRMTQQGTVVTAHGRVVLRHTPDDEWLLTRNSLRFTDIHIETDS